MDKKIKKLILFLGIFCAFVLKAGFALALEINYPSIGFLGQNFSLNAASSLSDYTCYLFGLIADLAFFIAVIVIAAAGVYYLISYGRGKFTSEAKEWVKAGVVGVLIVSCAIFILYTINPDLNKCSFKPIPAAALDINSYTSQNTSNVPTKHYQEIPIGTLTENLLTRTINCYGFDPQGNPIDGNQIKTDDGQKMAAPTYMNHDRADCLLQMTDGIQKKAEVIAKLSDAITNLMDLCLCSGPIDPTTGAKAAPVCNDPCNQNNLGCDPYSTSVGPAQGCPLSNISGNSKDNKKIPDPCTGKCRGDDGKGAACAVQSNGPPDCCPQKSGVIDPKTGKPLIDKNTGKELSVKGQIEHGPIKVDLSNCGGATVTKNNDSTNIKIAEATQQTQNNYPIASLISSWLSSQGIKIALADDATPFNPAIKTFAGLDEFRDNKFNFDYNAIKNFVEKNVYLNGKKIEVINVGNCTACQDNCQKYDPSSTDYSDCEKKLTDCQNQLDQCHKQYPWYQLTLVDQLIYLKGKASEMEQGLQADQKTLDSAKSAMSSCSNPGRLISSVDFLKIYQSTNQQQTKIQKSETFTDPVAGGTISVSKYCQGFNYNNSDCFKKCNDECPDTSGDAMNSYQNCVNAPCNGNSIDCMKAQEKCIEKAFSSRKCANADGGKDNNPKNFGDCITSCQTDCSTSCSKEYLSGSNEYKVCQDQCKNNSKCVLDNAGDCLFGAPGFMQCSDQVTDPGNAQYCINNAYLCKNGSNEYAGYQDCKQKLINCSVFSDQETCQDAPQGCKWDTISQQCSQDYSASFLYDNEAYQKCNDPYDPPSPGDACYSKTDTKAPCQDLCPETAKCQAASSCSYCPCSHIDYTGDQALQFSVPKKSISDTDSEDYNVGQEGCGTTQKDVWGYEITGPQCNGYSYNDDPLTFYCENRDDYFKDPNREGLTSTPLGSTMVCTKDQEIPVGQTVDDALNWAQEIIANVDKTTKNAQSIITDVIKVGKAKDTHTPPIQDYCTCTAKYETSKPVCKSNCIFTQILSEGPPVSWACGCSFDPCDGKSCQQVENYLSDVWNDYRQIKLDFIDFYTTMLKEPRSDIMKELTYSRQSTDNCSSVSSTYGSEARMLNCTRAKKEIIPPINTSYMIFNGQTLPGYCYGVDLGKYSGFNLSLTDNWFCCQLYSHDTTTIK